MRLSPDARIELHMLRNVNVSKSRNVGQGCELVLFDCSECSYWLLLTVSVLSP